MSAKNLNMNDSGVALPVVVRFYQLRNKESMEKADFKSIWKSDQEFLQEDMVDRKEVILHPDSRMVFEISLKEDVHYLGVMAIFRTPRGTAWRQIIPLQESKVRSVQITVYDRRIEVKKLR